jgi:hypothetical protein
MKDFPTRKSDGEISDIISVGGTVAYFLILCQLFPVFLSNIVDEKSKRIQQMMENSGLKMSIYYLVHYIFDYVLYVLIVCCLLASGFAFQYRFFTLSDPGTYLLLFLVWGHVLIALSFFGSIFFSSKKGTSVFLRWELLLTMLMDMQER